MVDSPKAARRREREKDTISIMIGMYCAGQHQDVPRSRVSYHGDPLCEECADLDAFAIARTQNCRQMETKTSCAECQNRCYSPARRSQIRAVMRYAGPRMMFRHPLAAIRHALGR